MKMELNASVVSLSYGSFGHYSNVFALSTYDDSSKIEFFTLYELTKLGELRMANNATSFVLG